MICFDIETMSKSSEAVILSMSAIYFDPDSKPTYNQLVDSAFFVKLDAEDQIKRLHRRADKSTMEWWAKQSDIVRKASFIPSTTDMKFEDGYELMRAWMKTKNDEKCWVFARGGLDQLTLDSMEEQLGITPIWPYARWRDVRTAIDFLYGTTNGYVQVPNFDSQAHVYKHHPTHDAAYDIMMLLYGEKE